MHRRRSQLALTAVAIALGLLVVLQIRAQTSGSELTARSADQLTVLVANLNTRNDQLRTEIATLESELSDLQSAQSRGETSVGQLEQDLARIRAWAGLLPVTGAGIRVTISGPIHASAINDIRNELRNAGAEAIAVGGIRDVPGVVVDGAPGLLAIGDARLRDPLEIEAIGNADTLAGTLARAGGIIAQVGATEPDTQITITPLERVVLPATDRSLRPPDGTPRL